MMRKRRSKKKLLKNRNTFELKTELKNKKTIFLPSKMKENIKSLIDSRKSAVNIDEAFDLVGEDNKKLFMEKIDELIKEAKIVKTKRNKLISPDVCGFISGKIISYNKNFLFARPLLHYGEDIYIPIESSKGAMVNDIVMINEIKNSPKGKSGAVERVVVEGERVLNGTIKRGYKKIEFLADNYYKFPITIRNAFTLGAKNGDKVQVYLYRPRNRYQIMAKVLKIYGTAQSARVCADSIIDDQGIPVEFSKEAILMAQRALNKGITEKELKGRLDLRNEKIFTIDGADAKDLDDAISIEKLKDGYKLGVHIADVSHYVKENTALDSEARERGTSVYFADRVIPMLPKELSNGICSLNANVDRLAFSCLMKIDNEGNLVSYEFKKSIICSKVRGVYSEVNSILDNTASEKIRHKYKEVIDSINLSNELADILILNSIKRGNMDLETDESQFTLDDNGVCIDVSLRERGKAERIIEQFMIVANEAAARYARSSEIPFIYRVHEEPNPEKLRVLSQIASLLGFRTNKLKIGVKSKDFANLLESAKNTPFSKLISEQVLRTMAKARYDHKPLGHFGLSLDDYCHFTSPIRRYPDTSIHRILTSLVNGEPIEKIKKKYENFVIESAYSSSINEVRAMTAERDTEKCYMAEFIAQHIGEEYDGTISGVTKNGIFVQLKNSVEGFISLNHFINNKFKFDGLACQVDEVTGEKMKIGDNMKIKIISADVSSGTIDFAPIIEKI